MQPADLGFGSLFWSVPDAVILGDVRGGTVVPWNPGAEYLFGYRSSEFAGPRIELLIAQPYNRVIRQG